MGCDSQFPVRFLDFKLGCRGRHAECIIVGGVNNHGYSASRLRFNEEKCQTYIFHTTSRKNQKQWGSNAERALYAPAQTGTIKLFLLVSKC